MVTREAMARAIEAAMKPHFDIECYASDEMCADAADAALALVRGEQPIVGAFHDDPSLCFTYYDGCHCTVETLEHNIKRAEAAETAQRLALEMAESLRLACERMGANLETQTLVAYEADRRAEAAEQQAEQWRHGLSDANTLLLSLQAQLQALRGALERERDQAEAAFEATCEGKHMTGGERAAFDAAWDTALRLVQR